MVYSAKAIELQRLRRADSMLERHFEDRPMRAVLSLIAAAKRGTDVHDRQITASSQGAYLGLLSTGRGRVALQSDDRKACSPPIENETQDHLRYPQ